MLGVLAYYGYFSNNKPHVAKYNVLQKLSYNLFLYMMIAQAFTGLALLKWTIPFIGQTVSQAMIGWNLGALLGSAAYALWVTRTLHYVLNWLFIIMTTIHLYLAASADVPCALDFFGLQELEVVEARPRPRHPCKRACARQRIGPRSISPHEEGPRPRRGPSAFGGD